MKSPLPSPGQIPPGRKTVYYVGMALSIVGLLMFLSTFVSGLAHFGDFHHFAEHTRSMGLRAFGGIILLMIGGVVMRIGAQGAFGAGMLLDPERAGRELEPWARMSGRLNDAAFSEMSTVRETIGDALGGRREPEPAPEIKIRCRSCQALNDEQARFCDQCGAAL